MAGAGAPGKAVASPIGADHEATGATSLRFAAAARALAAAAKASGLLAPGYRSPPRIVGRSRTVRRRSDGSVVVAVGVRNRPWLAVLADMVDGVVVANGLDGVEAERLRDELWIALEAVEAVGVAA